MSLIKSCRCSCSVIILNVYYIEKMFINFQFTLMGYMIEGGGSQTMSKTKEWLAKYPQDVHKLLALLTRVIIDYLLMQVKLIFVHHCIKQHNYLVVLQNCIKYSLFQLLYILF